jgi:hypothetical protein
MRIGLEFIKNHTTSDMPESPAWQYGWGHYDPGTSQITFHPLPHFNNYSWQGGKELPDAKLGWVLLNAEGGHPGDQQHAAIRRWIAPRSGAIEIIGELHHASDKGDGVRSRVISKKAVIGEWTAFNSTVSTSAKRLDVATGEVIDFVTDCRASVEFDSFTWSPTVRYVTAVSNDPRREWSAKTDFAGPQKEKPRLLTAWDKYAQVLLLANELVFVD